MTQPVSFIITCLLRAIRPFGLFSIPAGIWGSPVMDRPSQQKRPENIKELHIFYEVTLVISRLLFSNLDIFLNYLLKREYLLCRKDVVQVLILFNIYCGRLTWSPRRDEEKRANICQTKVYRNLYWTWKDNKVYLVHLILWSIRHSKKVRFFSKKRLSILIFIVLKNK